MDYANWIDEQRMDKELRDMLHVKKECGECRQEWDALYIRNGLCVHCESDINSMEQVWTKEL